MTIKTSDPAHAGGISNAQIKSEGDTLIIVTGGKSDLRIAIGDEIWELSTRADHQSLLNMRGQLRFQPAVAEVAMVKPKGYGKPGLQSLLQQHVGEIDVISARLDNALGEINSKENHVVMAMVLQTCRSDSCIPTAEGARPSKFQDIVSREPIAVGPVLSDFLASRYGLVPKDTETCEVGSSTFLNFLRDQEDLVSGEGDEQINPIAIQRIDDALTAALKAMKKSGIAQPKAVLIDSGGVPRLKDPLLALVRFRFRGRVSVLQCSETGGVQHLSRQAVTVQESCQARQIAWNMLGKGDFLGAAYAVGRYVDDPHEELWIRPLCQVAEFIRGEPITGEPFDELEALRKLGTLSILPALRTESAVASGRITEAITQVFIFYEAAIKDGVLKWLIDGPIEDDMPGGLGTLFHSLSSKVIQKLTTPTGPKGIIPYKKLEHTARTRFNFEGAAKEWCEALDLVSGKDTVWKSFNGKFFLYQDRYRLRQLRNLHTHSCLTQDQVNEAKNLFKEQDFWKETNKVGGCFLGQKLIKNVLLALVGEDVEKLYRQMVEVLIKRIENHRYV